LLAGTNTPVRGSQIVSSAILVMEKRSELNKMCNLKSSTGPAWTLGQLPLLGGDAERQ
jgi:hypothetical protein